MQKEKNAMSDLWSIFRQNLGRPIHKWPHYFPIYENHFSRYRNRPLTFLEIGCGLGGSLEMWKKYFGPHATIVGIDIREECREFESAQVSVRIGDQKDKLFLLELTREFGPFDIVLDDGSHIMNDIEQTFSFLYEKMDRCGVYMVEDLHTAYWEEYGGGLRKPENFIEISKSLIDHLNQGHTRGALADSAFHQITGSMHFYDSVIVFEKAPLKPQGPVLIGGPLR